MGVLSTCWNVVDIFDRGSGFTVFSCENISTNFPIREVWTEFKLVLNPPPVMDLGFFFERGFNGIFGHVEYNN